MTGWKNICCAVDFADPSRAAMEEAASLAGRLEAELTLVHVQVPPPSAAGDVLVSSRGRLQAEAEAGEELLARWRQDAERLAGRPVRSRTRSGDPAAEILRHAAEESCDVVIVGTHGRTGVSRLVLGSVAERVTRGAPCPVLVVHAHELREKEEIAEEAALYH